MTGRHAMRWLAVATLAVLLGCGGAGSAGGGSDDPSTFGNSGPATSGDSGGTTSGGSGGGTSGGSTGGEDVIELRAETGQHGPVFARPPGRCSAEPTTRDERGLRIAIVVRCGFLTAEVTNTSTVMMSEVELTDTLTSSLTRRIDEPATHSDQESEQEGDDGGAPTDPSESTTPDESAVEPVRDIGEMLRVSSSGGGCDLDGVDTVTLTCAIGDLQSGESVTVELAFDAVSNLEGQVRHAIDATGQPG